MDSEQLIRENQILKQKLKAAQAWMEREVHGQKTVIAKGKIQDNAYVQKKHFFSEYSEDMIQQKLQDFFGEILLLNVPESVLENIVSAEVSYFQLKENPQTDGMGVVSGYHKALDILIESYVTKAFRKFSKKQKQIYLRVNDPLEKSLNSVVNQGYILSVGRLYHLLDHITNQKELHDYGRCFAKFLEKYAYLSDILLSEEFVNIYKQLVESEILGKKRHIGKIELDETSQARKLLVGDLQEEKCLIYQLIKTQEMGY